MSGLADPLGAPGSISRREFLEQARKLGISLPLAAAILAACKSSGPSTSPSGGGTSTGNAVGTGGITGGPYPLARRDKPVTWGIFPDDPAIADGLAREAGPLKIYGYNDYIYKQVRNAFQTKYGVQIQYTVFDTPEQMVSTMRTNGSNFDLICTVTLDNIGKLVAAKLIQPLNKSYLTNVQSNLWPSLQHPFYDVAASYTVPYTLYSTGISWRNDLVTQDVASMTNPYDILWDATYKGKVGLLNGYRDTITAALLKNGITDVNTGSSTDLDRAKQDLLSGVAAMNWKFDHTDYSQLGQWDIHHTWSGQVAYYQYYLPKGLPIDRFSYVWPPQAAAKAPGLLQNDVFAIPKGAKNPVLAHAMIDFLFDPKQAIANYGYEGYQPPLNQIVPDQIMAQGLVPKNLANIIIQDADFQLGLSTLELAPAVDQMWQAIYQEVTGGA